MCTPTLHRVPLDHLALLAQHPRATPAVQAAFSRALLQWTRTRVARLSKRWPTDVDTDDVIQAFMLRCLTRHLSMWQSHRVGISAYLYRRLVGDVCDLLRSRSRAVSRFEDVDVNLVIDEDRDTEECLARVTNERRLRLVEEVVAALPARQRLAVETSLAGASMREVASTMRIHPSTLSREKTAAFAALREQLTPLRAAA